MNQHKFEFFVGLCMVIVVLYLVILSIRIAQNEFSSGCYEIQAVFSNCSGLRSGSPIMIAGVEIGRVKQIALQAYEANITLSIQTGVVLQKDAIASIKTKGVIGEKYIEITPGGDNQSIPAGGRLRDTQPAMDFEGLVSKYVQGNLSQPVK